MRRAGGASAPGTGGAGATAELGWTHEELELPCMGRESGVAGGGALLPSGGGGLRAHQGVGYTGGRGGWRCPAVSEFANKDLNFAEISMEGSSQEVEG